MNKIVVKGQVMYFYNEAEAVPATQSGFQLLSLSLMKLGKALLKQLSFLRKIK